MHKGTQAYTEYSFDEAVADFIMDKTEENPEFMTYKIGHIHSHNSMGVFFSGTDMDELFDNCVNHNFYLSLIVNNYMEMIAKLVYRVIPCAYSAKDEDGEAYEISSHGAESALLFTHDCKVMIPFQQPTVEERFQSRLEEIIEKADAPPKVVIQSYEQWKKENPGKDFSNPNINQYSGGKVKQLNQGKGSNKNKNKFKPWDKENPHQRSFDDLIGQDPEDKKKYFNPEDLQNLQIDIDEQFVCYFLRLGEFFPEDELQLALEALVSEGIEADKLCDLILPNIGDMYHKFNKKTYKDDPDGLRELGMDDFLATIENSIDLLSDYEGKFTFITPLIKELQMFIKIVEDKWKDAVFGKDEVKEGVAN